MTINPRALLASVLFLVACGGSNDNLRGTVNEGDGGGQNNEPELPPIDCSGQPDLSDAVVTNIRMNRIQQGILPPIGDLSQRHQLSIDLGVEFDEPDDSQAARPAGSRFGFSLFPRAQASDCLPPELGTRVVRLELTSDRDFHSDYPAGSLLNDLLLSPPDIGPEGRSIGSGHNGLWSIVFHTLPTEDLRHRFTVEAELDTGAVHQTTLDPVYFPASLPSEDEFPDDPVEAPGLSTSFLNDTGVTTCGDNEIFDLGCPVESFPLQDGEVGRDALAEAGTLEKTGDGPLGYDFTKIDNEGNALPADASDWSCARDNVTGLLWEVKTESGLHAIGNLYSWYNPDDTTNGGVVGEPDGRDCEGSACDTHAFVATLNEQNLCGRDDWRLPDWGDWFSVTGFDPLKDTGYGDHFYSGIEDTPSAPGWWTSRIAADSDQRVWALSPPHHGGDQGMFSPSADSDLQVRAVSRHRGPDPLDASDRGHCRRTAVEPATPSSAFEIVEGGAAVRHTTTNLEWQRCSLGQSWDGSECAGAAEVFNWQQALNQVHDHAGWRLPNIIELLSLYESCSYEPAINLSVFPGTPESSLQGRLQDWGEVRYWSASQTGSVTMQASEDAFAVNFGARGGSSNNPLVLDKARDLGFVRLVRDVEP